jgi:hypothetical protein
MKPSGELIRVLLDCLIDHTQVKGWLLARPKNQHTTIETEVSNLASTPARAPSHHPALSVFCSIFDPIHFIIDFLCCPRGISASHRLRYSQVFRQGKNGINVLDQFATHSSGPSPSSGSSGSSNTSAFLFLPVGVFIRSMTRIVLVSADGGKSSLRVGGLVARALLRRCGFAATVGL